MSIFIATPTTSMEILNKQINDYEMLPYDLRVKSDGEALAKYGKTNTELFDMMKASINASLDQNDPTPSGDNSIMSEGFFKHNDYNIGEVLDEDEAIEDKIYKAKMLEKEGIYIIYPYTIYDLYTMEDLNSRFEKFNLASQGVKDIANQKSITIFGKDVHNMYEINKIKVQQSQEEIDNFEKSDAEKYFTDISTRESSDLLEIQKRRMDSIYMSNTGSLLESTIGDKLRDTLQTEQVEIKRYKYVPNLTPNEIIHYLGESATEEEVDSVYEYQKLLSSALSGFDENAYYNEINDIINSDSENKERELVLKGFNPNGNLSEYSDYNNRIYDYIQEITNIDVIDVSEYEDTKPIDRFSIILEPIYIILSYTDTVMGHIINKVKHSQYSHTSIAFDETFDKMYSFNMRDEYNGLTLENLDAYKRMKIAKLKVLTIFTTVNQKKRILTKLNFFIENQERTRYSFKNLFRILFNKVYNDEFNLKLVCSQFVDSLLRAANIELVPDKANNLVSPVDFERVANPKVFVVFEGDAKNYKPKKIKLITDALRVDRKNGIKVMESTIGYGAFNNVILTTKDLLLIKCVESTEISSEYKEEFDKLNEMLVAEDVLACRETSIDYNNLKSYDEVF